ncbi:MAG: VOC family protein [Alphaproteobacteria bacterium]|nr:VOC family protein [Alphaproteobacteria bacterium]
MTISLTPYLWYSKDDVEAAHFYTSIIPGSHIKRISALQVESPSGPPGSVKVVEFVLAGRPINAFAARAHHEGFNDAISLMLECDTQEEMDRLWSAFTENGGREVECGWLIDRYGLRWQITPRVLADMTADQNKAKAEAATNVMLGSKKLNIAELTKAYEAA